MLEDFLHGSAYGRILVQSRGDIGSSGVFEWAWFLFPFSKRIREARSCRNRSSPRKSPAEIEFSYLIELEALQCVPVLAIYTFTNSKLHL